MSNHLSQSVKMENKPSVPEEFICPLTLNIMHDPVMDRTGRSYERKAILKWMGTGNFTCPLTRRDLNLSDLVTNHALQIRIQKWRSDHRDYQEETDDETDEDDTNVEEDVSYALGMLHVGMSLDQYYELLLTQHRRRQMQGIVLYAVPDLDSDDGDAREVRSSSQPINQQQHRRRFGLEQVQELIRQRSRMLFRPSRRSSNVNARASQVPSDQSVIEC